jgi:hypothetical protein
MSSIVIAGDTSGSVTLQAPAVSGSTVLNLPATSGTIQASGAGYTTNGVAYATSATGLVTGSTLSYNGTRLLIGGVSAGTVALSIPAGDITSDVSSGSFAVGNYGDTSSELRLSTRGFTTFRTGATDGTNGTERARITSGGYFKASNSGTYIGVASTYHELTSDANQIGVVVANTNASLTTAGILYVTGSRTTTNSTYSLAYFLNGNTSGQCAIRDSGNVVNTNNSYGSISDVKLKENIVDASPKLADLMQVKVRNYNLKASPEHKQLGVIAQELETVFPAMVEQAPDTERVTTTDENGKEVITDVPTGTYTKSVKYSVFVPMLIKALQEQQALITQLTERITALEAN